MKGLLRALVGILATIVIVVLIERTMVSFEFFPDTESAVATVEKPDSLAADSLKEVKNQKIKGAKLMTLSDGTTAKANKIYKKSIPLDDKYLVNITHSDTIHNYMNEITIGFEFEEKDLMNSIQFLVIDGFDTKSDKTYKQFYKPISGINTLTLKNNFTEGTHIFRVGYFFKRDVERKKYQFYHQEFKLLVLE
ncbi:MAG: hypothetical protein ACPG19_16025, partial [Saprospiraceae bacterium]